MNNDDEYGELIHSTPVAIECPWRPSMDHTISANRARPDAMSSDPIVSGSAPDEGAVVAAAALLGRELIAAALPLGRADPADDAAPDAADDAEEAAEVDTARPTIRKASGCVARDVQEEEGGTLGV